MVANTPFAKAWSQPWVNCWSRAVSPCRANAAARSQAARTAGFSATIRSPRSS